MTCELLIISKMLKNRFLWLLAVAISSVFQLQAQVTLPYFTGFDNADEQEGWKEYKTASTERSHWNFATVGGMSNSGSISHDYSPSTGIKLTDNWFVSPGFYIKNGGSLDSLRYKFTGFSMPEDGDTIAVYLITGSQDPTKAKSKILLFDFRNSDYVADNTYRLLKDIELSSSNEMSYLAIRYRNTDCSSKWLTVIFDNIAISGIATSITKSKLEPQIQIYPNPSNGNFILSNLTHYTSISILNSLGQVVYYKSGFHNAHIDLNISEKGVYFVRIEQLNNLVSKRVIIQ